MSDVSAYCAGIYRPRPLGGSVKMNLLEIKQSIYYKYTPLDLKTQNKF